MANPVLVAESILAPALGVAEPVIHFAITVDIVLVLVCLADRMAKNPVGTPEEWEQWVDGSEVLLVVSLVVDWQDLGADPPLPKHDISHDPTL